MRALAESSIESVAQIAARRGIAIDVSVGAEIRALCDRKLIEQALINLIENAVKYSAENGRVEVGARILSRADLGPFLAERSWSGGASPPWPTAAKRGRGPSSSRSPIPGSASRRRRSPGFSSASTASTRAVPGKWGGPASGSPSSATWSRPTASASSSTASWAAGVDLRVHPSGRLTNLRGRGQGRTTIGDCLLLLLPGAASPITSTRHLAGLTGPRRRK